MNHRLRDEQGWALVTAMMLMAIMLGTILSVATYLDGQTKLGSDTRKRETAFNMSEAALNSQIFALSQDWPGAGNSGTPYPTCTQVSTGSRCPNAPGLSKLIASPDTTGNTWQTVIRDNGGSAPNFYSDAITLGQPAYDFNHDGQVWVRATSTARGKTRTMVTLVRVEEQAEDIPHAAVIAGRVNNSNTGNKPLIDLSNSTGANGFVGVRCSSAPGESAACVGQARPASGTWPTDRVTTQINPYNGHVQEGYSSASIMTPAARERLRARAIADGTYFAGCPATWPSATVTWVESGDCQIAGVQVNSPAAPGLLVINSGTIHVHSQADFYGVIYVVNSQNSSGIVAEVHSNGVIHGGVLVDGDGIFDAGSSKENVIFDDNAYKSVRTYGTAGMVQNTWREIKG